MTLLIVFLLTTILVSFLCSILEAVLMSTPLSHITMREEEGYRPAKRFKEYKTDTSKPIAAILSLNTIANTLGAAGVGWQAGRVFGDTWVGVVSAVMTVLILVFSEIIPKTIGTNYWKHLMGFATGAINVLVVVLYPLVLLTQGLTRLVAPKEKDAVVSREEVSAMANVGEDEGVIDEDENTIIQNVIKLDSVTASDVMTPRIVASIAPESMTLKEFFDNDDYSHFSRIPVYSESAENISGFILRSEALEDLAEDKFSTRLGSLRRDIHYFNENEPISNIWDQMLSLKAHIAIIIDEYGTFQGIITLEDIIETIFGLEIMDESDTVSDMQQLARERWERRQKMFRKAQMKNENINENDNLNLNLKDNDNLEP